MSNAMSNSDNAEQWLRERLADAVPTPPPSADRLGRLRTGREQVRRRRAVGVVLAACIVVAGFAVAVPAALGHDTDRGVGPTDQTPTTAPTTNVAPALECPPEQNWHGDGGPASLASGPVAARLCSGSWSSAAPADLLTSKLDELVASVNAQPEDDGSLPNCMGRVSDRYLLLLGYPDGTVRRVTIDFSGCRGSIRVGRTSRLNPYEPYEEFMDLLREQRKTATPPSDVPAPACLAQNSGMSPVADPGEMVAALMCVSYDEGGSTTNVGVPSSDLATILEAWRTGPKTPEEKGPGCGPTIPTWVLSGVTQWGDPVQITAECDRPTNGQDWVELSPQARDVVDRLIVQAGVQVNDGSEATTAWSLVYDWLSAVNARARISYDRSAAAVGDIANRMWVADPWLPQGELDWDLLGASPTEASGWRFAWRVPARTPTGEAVFVVVRDSKDEPWRILSLTR